MTALSRTIVAGLLAAVGIVGAPGVAWAADTRDPSRAAHSMAAAFQELAQAPQAPGVPAGQAVDEYVGRDIARVVDSRGRRSVLLSSLPLRSRIGDRVLRPLSLDLRGGADGQLRPENPVAHVRIATDPRQGFTIGPDPSRLVTIVPVGVREDAPDATVFAGQALFAGARTAGDLLIRPSATGVQTFEQLTGAAAPQAFSYRLELDDNQTAELVDGVVTIKQGGAVIVRSLPPMAIDANRRPVPVAITLDGATVRLDVPHRDRGFRYPIAVDPDWTSSYDYASRPGLGLQGWSVGGRRGQEPEYYDAFINNVHDLVADPGGQALGFFIRPRVIGSSRIFPTGVGATLFFNAPGTTSIRSVTYDDVHRFNDRDRQTLRLALYGPSFAEFDDHFAAEILSEAAVTLPTDPFPDDQASPATTAVMWMFSSPCVEGTDRNCPRVIASATRTLLKVGSVQLVLTDFDFPSTQAPGTLRDLQDSWTNATDTRTLDAAAIDEGSGVRELSVSVKDSDGTHPVRSIRSPCHPDHDQIDPPQESAICPRDLRQPLSVDTSRLPEGKSTFIVDASDLADNTAAAGGTSTAFSVYLDRNKPTTAVSGDLHDAAGTWVRPRRSSPVTVTGTDIAGGEGKTAGIAHNHLSAVDESGDSVLDLDAATCTPPGPLLTPCDPGKASTFTVDSRPLPEGPVTFTASSIDLAGNASNPVTWTVRIDRTPPAARATGDLLSLTGQHTNSTSATSVTLHGRDAASGVARVQLIASNSNGEKILADRDTCTAADVDTSDGSCPHTPAVEVSVDPAELPDGPTTFIARAIDHAGIPSVDNQDWDTYVDHTPPDPPDSVTVTQTGNTSVQVTWPTVVDRPLGSGNVSYEYLITAGGQPVGTWRRTANPYAQAGGLPPGTTISVLVRAIDAAHNVGLPTSGTTSIPVASISAAAFDERRAAHKLRPILRFDSEERWRPRAMRDFFAEGGHQVCHSSDDCADARRAADLDKHHQTGDYLDITGSSDDGEDYHDPGRAPCLRAPCDKGSAIYYNVTLTNSHLYADYWWFFRYNDVESVADFALCKGTDFSPCYDHEGDWEGVTTVTAPRDSDRIQYIAYSAHGRWWRYTKRAVERREGVRAVTYVARGTHANYPLPCPEDCKETDDSDNGIGALPETQSNGLAEWERNSDHMCKGGRTCLRALPETDRRPTTHPSGNAARWAAWPGRWGKESEKRDEGPESPGQQPHYQKPWTHKATKRDVRQAQVAPRSEEDAADRDCSAWQGPSVAAVVCDPVALSAALSANVLDHDGLVAVRSSAAAADRVVGSAPGLAQVVGDSVRPGEHLTISGPTGASTSLFLRVAVRRGQVRTYMFDGVAAPTGGQATVTVPTKGLPVLTTATGATIRARPAAARPAPPSVGRIRRDRRGRVVFALRALVGKVRVELLSATRRRVGTRTLTRANGAVRTARITARGARHIRITAIDEVGASSQPLERRIPRRRTR